MTSQSIDARGTTGIARSGLLVRATSNASTNGQAYDPRSISLSDALTITRGGHTFKIGGEYRNIASKFQFLGSTEITYNSINDFIDNRPAQVAVALDSPFFTPQQFYAIGFAQDTWRVNSRLTLELGLRYDFYSVVKEKDDLSKPFFIEDNAFAANDAQFYNPDKNNFAPRLSAVYQLTPKTALRAGYGHFYGPGQFEDRIQPIENYIERRRVQSTDVPGAGLPGRSGGLSQPALGPRLHARSSRRVQRPVRRERRAGAARRAQPDRRLHRQPRQGHVPARRRQHLRQHHPRRVRRRRSDRSTTRRRAASTALVINGNPISGCGKASYDALQIGLTRRFRSGLSGGLQYQYSRNEGTTQGSNEAATASNTFDYNTEFGTESRPTSRTRSTARWCTCCRSTGAWAAAGVSAASSTRAVGRAHQRHHRAAGHRHGERRDRDQHSRRQLARHAAAGSRRRASTPT